LALQDSYAMRAGLDAYGRHDIGWLSALGWSRATRQRGARRLRARSKPPSRPLAGCWKTH